MIRFWLFALFVLLPPVASAVEPIRIGDVNSYSLDPLSVRTYENGVNMALEEINAAGGVLGRPLEMLIRDDKGNPADALRLTEELVKRDHVVMIAGAWYNATAEAIANYTVKNKIPFFATFSPGDTIIGKHATPYTFSLWPTIETEMDALVGAAAKLPVRKWVMIVSLIKDGHIMEGFFREKMQRLRPDVEFLPTQYYTQEKIAAGPLVNVLLREKPEGIMFLAFGSDLTNLIREGQTRGLWNSGVMIATPYNGSPDNLRTVAKEIPEGWTITGYPVEQITDPEHKRFITAYQTKYKELPTMGALAGYMGYHIIAAALRKAGSTDPEAITKTLTGFGLDNTPLGRIVIDAKSHQANAGTYVGVLKRGKDGKAHMADWRYFSPLPMKE